MRLNLCEKLHILQPVSRYVVTNWWGFGVRASVNAATQDFFLWNNFDWSFVGKSKVQNRNEDFQNQFDQDLDRLEQRFKNMTSNTVKTSDPDTAGVSYHHRTNNSNQSTSDAIEEPQEMIEESWEDLV